MNPGKTQHKYEQLGKAIAQLGAVVGDVHDDRDRDALIQRFEFTIELYWKTLKEMLSNAGVNVNTTPKAVFTDAYAQGWLIGEDQSWYQMLKDRNESSHTYNESLAIEIAERIEQHFPLLKETYDGLRAFV